jgi:cytosine permease
MMTQKIDNIAERMDDHALERVPDAQRTGWLKLSWNTAGIVTTLVQMFFGALVSFAAGLHVAIVSGIFVTIVGAALGWAVGNVGTQTGLSSTLITREYGLGTRGSCLASLILGFMIIGFLAIENALLYNGMLFFFDLPDTLLWKVVIYGVFTIGWIVLTAFGFELVAKVSSIALLAFLALLAWMLLRIVAHSSQAAGALLSFGPQMPAQALAGMGITSTWDAYVFCINVLIGSAGALALVDADFGRYARTSRDIGLAALTGNVAMSIVMLSIGGIVMYAGFDYVVNYFTHVRGLPEAQAQALALASPSSIASTFIIFGGAVGAFLMLLAQSKAQVLNTYSGSLALANFSDAVFGWRPGRFVFVVLANAIGLVMLYGKLLALVNSWITILGVLTTSLAGVVVADFYIVRGKRQQLAGAVRQPEAFNWAGIVTIVVGTGLAHYVMQGIVRIEFFTSLVVSLVLYPLLRLAVFRRPAAASVA